ncbi:DNA internalization-related competence protein ComEC/Rec2 [Vibrio caribbeanicus]|uniref:DNA internalization-related competence protein ComEC/Rec2 n=1 Tax=Vibrio caribbeanicus TaxID=701175 RepID=UPI0030DB6AEA
MTLYLHYWTLVSFVAVVMSSPHWPELPNLSFLMIGITILCLSFKYRKGRFSVGLIFAFIVVLSHGHILQHKTKILFQSGQRISAIVEADSLFKPIQYGFQGIVIVKKINDQHLPSIFRPKIWLTSPVPLQYGEVLDADLRLKNIRGMMNVVGPDKEKFALSKGIVGYGNVVATKSLAIESRFSFHNYLINNLNEKIRQLNNIGMIEALLFGIKNNIDDELRDRLQQSGLSHLLTISGLHIGIIYSLGWGAGLVFFRLNSSFIYFPAVFGVSAAFFYAWLAGFSVPTLRAFVMCVIYCLMQYLIGRMSGPYKFLLTLSIILAIYPFSVVSPSLWMSVGAIAVIFLYQSMAEKKSHWLKTAFCMQMFIFVFMAPIVVLFFQGISTFSLFLNILFVPWFSFVVIPLNFLAFLTLSFGQVNQILWSSVDASLDLVIYVLNHLPQGWWDIESELIPYFFFLPLVVMCSLIFSKKALGLLGITIIFSLRNWLTPPSWQLNVLDVGHGLAIVIIQGNRALVYDTGSATKQSSKVDRVVTPLLRYHGVESLDYLVISHFDNDHAGGANILRDDWSPRELVSSQSTDASIPCIKGESWKWGALNVDVIWPEKTVSRAYNPHSCVLKVSDNKSEFSVLLTGDIVAMVEWLLIREPWSIKAELLVVPHHGSKTSSIPKFIETVEPSIAVTSSTIGGRWNLPDPAVKKRYTDRGVEWIDTGSSGQVVVNVYTDDYKLNTRRVSKGNSWYRHMLRKQVE